MPKAVIFDVDGTLVDSVDQHAEAWQEAFRHFGHEFDVQSIRGQIGKGGDQLMPVFLSQNDLTNQGEKINQYRSWIFKKKFLPHITAFPSVRAPTRGQQDSCPRVVGQGRRTRHLYADRRCHGPCNHGYLV